MVRTTHIHLTCHMNKYVKLVPISQWPKIGHCVKAKNSFFIQGQISCNHINMKNLKQHNKFIIIGKHMKRAFQITVYCVIWSNIQKITYSLTQLDLVGSTTSHNIKHQFLTSTVNSSWLFWSTPSVLKLMHITRLVDQIIMTTRHVCTPRYRPSYIHFCHKVIWNDILLATTLATTVSDIGMQGHYGCNCHSMNWLTWSKICSSRMVWKWKQVAFSHFNGKLCTFTLAFERLLYWQGHQNEMECQGNSTSKSSFWLENKCLELVIDNSKYTPK